MNMYQALRWCNAVSAAQIEGMLLLQRWEFREPQPIQAHTPDTSS